MDILNSRAYRALEVVIDFFLLNLLWLILCLPVITIYPATAALFGVVRGWVRDKESGVFTAFFGYLKENFVQSLLVGIVWTIIGVILGVNLALAARMTSAVRLPSIVLTGTAGIAYLLTTPYLFPVMVHYRTSWTWVIRNAFVIAITQPLLTFFSLTLLLLFATLTLLLPATLLVTGSLAAYLIYLLCDRAFERIGAGGDDEGDAPADGEE